MLLNRQSQLFEVHNSEDNAIAVKAQKAAADAGGIGYIVLKEGQKLSVRTALTDNGSIRIEVLPGETDDTTKPIYEETFTAINSKTIDIPAGKYTIRFTADKGTTGSMDITAE